MLSFHRSCAECDMYVCKLFQSHMQVCAPFPFIAICTGGCLNGGTCVLAEKCDCSKGWSGHNCELGNSLVIVLCDVSVCIHNYTVILSVFHISGFW